MMTVTFYFRNQGKIMGLEAHGHCGAGDHGNDIVCAAASFLVMGFAQNVKMMHEHGKLERTPRLDLVEGNSEVEMKPSEKFYTEALIRLDTVQSAFLLLASHYPQYVRVRTYQDSLT